MLHPCRATPCIVVQTPTMVSIILQPISCRSCNRHFLWPVFPSEVPNTLRQTLLLWRKVSHSNFIYFVPPKTIKVLLREYQVYHLSAQQMVLDIVSKVAIYRNIEVSMYGIEHVLPSIPWHPHPCFLCRYCTKVSIYQNIEIVSTIILYRYRIELDSDIVSISKTINVSTNITMLRARGTACIAALTPPPGMR